MDDIKALTWKTQWNTGFDSIDQQHKRILQAIKALNREFDVETDQPIAEKLFSALEAYAKVHFTYEESVMTKIKYPGLPEQKVEHQIFIDQIKAFRESAKDPMNFDDIIARTQGYLLDWLLNHILEVDMSYKAAFKKAGVQ